MMEGSGGYRPTCSSRWQQTKSQGPAPMASFDDASSLASLDFSTRDSTPHNPDKSYLGQQTPSSQYGRESLQNAIQRDYENTEHERILVQGRRENSVTSGFREGFSTLDLRHSTDELETEHNIRQVYVRRPGSRSSQSPLQDNSAPYAFGPPHSVGPFGNYKFRMIDASATDLRDPIDRNRRSSTASSNMNDYYACTGDVPERPRSRHSSICSSSTLRSLGKSAVAIETSFCGPRPIPTQVELELSRQNTERSSEVSSTVTSSDLADRNLVEEIQKQTQLPLRKQESYSQAIYSSACRKGSFRKQASYEAAVESGAANRAAGRRTKQILKIRKQDSYVNAIGGSFEDNDNSYWNTEPKKMRKQESYLMAVGEMSPVSEDPMLNLQTFTSSPRMRKQDSYLRALRLGSYESEEPTVSLRKQPSYQMAIMGESISSDAGNDQSATFGNRQSSLDDVISPKPFRKQNSYAAAIKESILEEDAAAVLIQSTFKGYKARKDIEEIKMFYKQVSESDYGSKPSEPLSRKKRQDSYLRAVGSISPEDDSKQQQRRSWKIRQDSYQKAVCDSSSEYYKQPKRQDSYLMAMNGSEYQTADAEHLDSSGKWSSHRQESYQLAMDSVLSPVSPLPWPQTDIAQDQETEDAVCKIQATFKGFKVRKKIRQEEEAVTKIQAGFKGYKTRQQLKTVRAAVKIQSQFRGYKVRQAKQKRMNETVRAITVIQSAYRRFRARKIREQAAVRNAIEEINAATTIQAAFKGYQTKRLVNEKRELQAYQVAMAATRIQAAYKGFKTRRRIRQQQQQHDDLPDLNDADVADAAVKIQAAFKGFQTRKMVKQQKEMDAADLAMAAVKIQAVYKGFKARQQLKQKQPEEEELPDLNDADVADAAVKIQAAFKGFQTRKIVKKQKDSDAAAVALAAMRIQAAFKGFLTRKRLRELKDLPDLESEDVANAAVKIQATYKGFVTRRNLQMNTDQKKPGFVPTRAGGDKNDCFSAKVQSAHKGLPMRPESNYYTSKSKLLVDERDSRNRVIQKRSLVVHSALEERPSEEFLRHPGDVVAAAITIQRFFRNFRKRHEALKKSKKASSSASSSSSDSESAASEDEVEDSSASDDEGKAKKVVSRSSSSSSSSVSSADSSSSTHSASASRAKSSSTDGKADSADEDEASDQESLTNDAELESAVMKIQSAFKGMQDRKLVKKKREEKLELENAAAKIQSMYKGYKVRKVRLEQINSEKEAAVKIQSAFRGHKVRKETIAQNDPITEVKTAMDNRPSQRRQTITAPTLDKTLDKYKLTSGTSNDNFLREKRRNTTADLTDIRLELTQKTNETNNPQCTNSASDALVAPASSSDDHGSSSSSEGPSPEPDSEPDSPISALVVEKTEEAPPPGKPNDVVSASSAFGLIRKASLGNFFKRIEVAATPSPKAAPEKGEKNVTGPEVTQISPEVEEGSKSSNTGSKLSNIFSSAGEALKSTGDKSMFSLPNVVSSVTAVEASASSGGDSSAGGGFFSLFKTGDKKKAAQPPPSSATRDSATEVSNESSTVKPDASKDAAVDTDKEGAEGDKAASKTNTVIRDDFKGDLIHVVLTAVEENWLNQAPQPTLDKSKALKVSQDDSVELSESERETSEADYMKQKQKSQASGAVSDEESYRLCQDSNGEDLPYLESTLPQERPGVVTITPSSMRVSECKLTGVNRPRSNSPMHLGKISILSDSKDAQSLAAASQKLMVKLPGAVADTRALSAVKRRPLRSYQSVDVASVVASSSASKTSILPGWVNCEELPSTPKPIRRYESNEDMEEDSLSESVTSASSKEVSSAEGKARASPPPSTAPGAIKKKPPVPQRSYSVKLDKTRRM